MSEQSPEVRRFDDDTPESAVVRYAWDIDVMESQGEIEFENTYLRALLKLEDIFTKVRPSADMAFSQICHEILPGPYEESGLEKWEWCDRLRLAPAILMRLGAPDLDDITPEYIRAVSFATLSKEPRHGSECMSYLDDENGARCLRSDLCPAKSLNYIFVQTAADLATRREILMDDSEVAVQQKTMDLIYTLRDCLRSYGLTNYEIFHAQHTAARNVDRNFLREAEIKL